MDAAGPVAVMVANNKPLAEARGLLRVLELYYLPVLVLSIVMPPGVCWFFFSSFALRVAMVLSRH